MGRPRGDPTRGERRLQRRSLGSHFRRRPRRQSGGDFDRPLHGGCPAERYPAHDGKNMMMRRPFVWLQHLLPQHALSRLVLRATRVRTPWLKNLLVRGFLRLYSVDMTEAAQADPLSYGSFNEFFTRSLKADARPIAPDPKAIACPVDGTVSEVGAIEGDRLLQAKGRYYDLGELLAARAWAKDFA